MLRYCGNRCHYDTVCTHCAHTHVQPHSSCPELRDEVEHKSCRAVWSIQRSPSLKTSSFCSLELILLSVFLDFFLVLFPLRVGTRSSCSLPLRCFYRLSKGNFWLSHPVWILSSIRVRSASETWDKVSWLALLRKLSWENANNKRITAANDVTECLGFNISILKTTRGGNTIFLMFISLNHHVMMVQGSVVTTVDGIVAN